jgi:hypothetical protein
MLKRSGVAEDEIQFASIMRVIFPCTPSKPVIKDVEGLRIF